MQELFSIVVSNDEEKRRLESLLKSLEDRVKQHLDALRNAKVLEHSSATNLKKAKADLASVEASLNEVITGVCAEERVQPGRAVRSVFVCVYLPYSHPISYWFLLPQKWLLDGGSIHY